MAHGAILGQMPTIDTSTLVTQDSLTNTLNNYVTTSALNSRLSNYATTASLNNYLLKSGGTMTGQLNMGRNKITNLADGTADTDAAPSCSGASDHPGFYCINLHPESPPSAIYRRSFAGKRSGTDSHGLPDLHSRGIYAGLCIYSRDRSVLPYGNVLEGHGHKRHGKIMQHKKCGRNVVTITKLQKKLSEE